ncbi:MAG: type II secretion system F family protein [bacterium]|nr:type II secretion system F family protein [bacterium]
MNLPFFGNNYKLSSEEKLALVEGLSIMLSAGIPILEALDSISEDAVNKNAKELVRDLSDQINRGKTLSEALEKYPDSFDRVLVSIVRSGEESGKLDKVLAELTENIKTSIETTNNIRSALFYPILVIISLVVVSFYLFIFALPRVAKVFLDLGINLPAYSAFILRSSLFVQKYYVYVILLFLLVVVVGIRLLMNRKIRSFFFSILARIPSIRSLVRFMDLSKFTSTTSLLLSAGLPIIEALDIAANVVVSPKLRGAIVFLKDSLTQGSGLSEAMKKRGESFPSLLRRVVGVGEETGNLDESLKEISGHYEKQFTDIVKNLTVLLEPILLIIIGVVVGVVLLSIIAPIYQLIGQINQ